MAQHKVGSALSSSPDTVRCIGPPKNKGVILVRAFHNKEDIKGCEPGCPVDYFSFQILYFSFHRSEVIIYSTLQW